MAEAAGGPIFPRACATQVWTPRSLLQAADEGAHAVRAELAEIAGGLAARGGAGRSLQDLVERAGIVDHARRRGRLVDGLRRLGLQALLHPVDVVGQPCVVAPGRLGLGQERLRLRQILLEEVAPRDPVVGITRQVRLQLHGLVERGDGLVVPLQVRVRPRHAEGGLLVGGIELERLLVGRDRFFGAPRLHVAVEPAEVEIGVRALVAGGLDDLLDLRHAPRVVLVDAQHDGVRRAVVEVLRIQLDRLAIGGDRLRDLSVDLVGEAEPGMGLGVSRQPGHRLLQRGHRARAVVLAKEHDAEQELRLGVLRLLPDEVLHAGESVVAFAAPDLRLDPRHQRGPVGRVRLEGLAIG